MEAPNNTNSPFASKGQSGSSSSKRTRILRVVCNQREKETLFAKAKSAGLSLSEFLRRAGLDCQVVTRNQIPAEVLLLTTRISGAASSLNQLAKFNNQHIQFLPEERQQLFNTVEELHQLSIQIKNYLKS